MHTMARMGTLLLVGGLGWQAAPDDALQTWLAATSGAPAVFRRGARG